jgi:hypothetical protein
MFDVARNQVSVLSDDASIVNRDRLLILSEPNSLYNEPNFGVGLIKYLWHYNVTDRSHIANQRAIIEDNIREQLRIHEPYCKPDETQFADELLFSEQPNSTQFKNPNELDMTVAIKTTYSRELAIDIKNEVQN